ncbi:MAG: KH domain-containing protein [Candidatus Woesearchaeota archaeon]
MTPSPPQEDLIIEHILRVPKSRIAVIIGTDGVTKRQIESQTQTRLTIDSHEGDITIQGRDAVKCFVSRDIVKAIGRGFNPEIALFLLKSDYAFELIDMGEVTRNKNDLLRVKGRIIGKEGKTREILEKQTETHISVFGKTVGIIGEVEHVLAARQAVDMILDGSPHANVYKWLESKKRALTKTQLLGNSVEIKDEFKKYVE